MPEQTAAANASIISHESVVLRIQAMLRKAQVEGWKDDDLSNLSGVPTRTIRSYRVEGKEPSLSNALSLWYVLGPKATDPILGLMGVRAVLIDSDDEKRNLSAMVADSLQSLSVIAAAAADGRIDHNELPACQDAADTLIRLLLDISSLGKR